MKNIKIMNVSDIKLKKLMILINYIILRNQAKIVFDFLEENSLSFCYETNLSKNLNLKNYIDYLIKLQNTFHLKKSKNGISSCLCGINTKYNGENNYDDLLYYLYTKEQFVLICPEVLGGLPTPRAPSEIKEDKVFNKLKEDVTDFFKVGATKSLNIVKEQKIDFLILKENSPSCGVHSVYDGTFTAKKIFKSGVATNLFKKNKIKVVNESLFILS